MGAINPLENSSFAIAISMGQALVEVKRSATAVAFPNGDERLAQTAERRVKLAGRPVRPSSFALS
jgi:hypothetical protein